MRFKYPRTPHLPWSPGATSDDVLLCDVSHFHDKLVVVTEKMDGENTSIYADGIHARSLDSAHHESRAWVKALQQQIGYQLPGGWRLCGENLYAQHSLRYENLPSYFMLFSVWNEDNRSLSWREVEVWARLLGLKTPRVLYRGVFDMERIKGLPLNPETQEGYVVRLSSSFHYDEFALSVAKYVRTGHVTTDKHWMSRAVIKNGLATHKGGM